MNVSVGAARVSAIATIMDACGVAALLIGPLGHIEHRTPALAALLSADPESPKVLDRLGAVARQWRVARGSLKLAHPSLLTIETRAARYRVTLTALPDAALGTLVAALEQRTPPIPTPSQLAQRWGCTLAQARIAVRLAAGESPATIAAGAGLSVHTVRRHIEALRERLQVPSATQLALRALRDIA